MSDAPERITAWGDQATLGVVYKAGPRPMQNMVPFRATEYTRADLSDALLREAVEALEEIAVRDSLPTPSFGGVKLGQYAYINRAGPLAEIARATLAKLRAHLEGETE